MLHRGRSIFNCHTDNSAYFHGLSSQAKSFINNQFKLYCDHLCIICCLCFAAFDGEKIMLNTSIHKKKAKCEWVSS